MQSYFVILILGNVSKATNRVSLPVILCTQYITSYFVQLFFLIQTFDDVKSLSRKQIPPLLIIDSIHTQKNPVGLVFTDDSTQLLLIQKLHQNFNFSIYGADNIDNTSMKLVFICKIIIIIYLCYYFFYVSSDHIINCLILDSPGTVFKRVKAWHVTITFRRESVLRWPYHACQNQKCYFWIESRQENLQFYCHNELIAINYCSYFKNFNKLIYFYNYT